MDDLRLYVRAVVEDVLRGYKPLEDDEAYKQPSTYVPRWIKRKIKLWTKKMRLS